MCWIRSLDLYGWHRKFSVQCVNPVTRIRGRDGVSGTDHRPGGADLTGEVELLRKQLDDAERELERLVIARQVITQLMAVTRPPARQPPAARRGGFGLLVPPRSQASGTGDLPEDYRSLLEAVSAAAAETGGPVACTMAAQRVGLNVTGRQSENVRARLKRLKDRGWLRRTAARTFIIAP